MEAPTRTGRSGRAAIAGVIATSAAVLIMASVEGSPITPLLPADARAIAPLRWLASALGLDALSPDGKALVAWLIAVATAGAFLFAAREAWRGGISERSAVWLGVGLFAVTLAVPLLFSRDVYNYGLYGKIVSEYGGNPYTMVPSDVPGDPFTPLSGPKWANDPSVYGPAFTVLSAGITSVLQGVVAVSLAFKVLACAAGVAALFAIRSAARSVAPARVAFAVVLFAWNPVVVFNAAGGGHNDLLVAAAVAGGFALLCGRRPLLAVTVLTVGTLVKASGGIALVLALVWLIAASRTRLRTAIQVLGVSVGISAILAAPFLQLQNPSLGLVDVAGNSGGFAISAFLERAANVLPPGMAGPIGGLVHVGLLVVFAVVFIALAIRVGRTGAADGELAELGAAWGWAFLVFMCTTPFFLPWYLAWMLPVAYLLPRRGRLVVFVAVVAGIAFQVVSEPLRSEAGYDTITFIRDWGVRPIVFGFLAAVVAAELWRRLRDGAPLAAPQDEPGERGGQDGRDAAEAVEA